MLLVVCTTHVKKKERKKKRIRETLPHRDFFFKEDKYSFSMTIDSFQE